MTINHAGHNHPSTPGARARCRKGRTQPSTVTTLHRATPRVLPDEVEEHPAEKSRCCYNCKVRKIEWMGRVYMNLMHILVCDKCKYILDPDYPIKYWKV